MISKTKIGKKADRKTNMVLKALIIRLKKQGKLDIANILALPRRKGVSVNLDKLAKETKENDVVIVPGKVLGTGTLPHGLTLAAFSFSEQAKSKLKNCRIASIEELSLKNFKVVK